MEIMMETKNEGGLGQYNYNILKKALHSLQLDTKENLENLNKYDSSVVVNVLQELTTKEVPSSVSNLLNGNQPLLDNLIKAGKFITDEGLNYSDDEHALDGEEYYELLLEIMVAQQMLNDDTLEVLENKNLEVIEAFIQTYDDIENEFSRQDPEFRASGIGEYTYTNAYVKGMLSAMLEDISEQHHNSMGP